ncbi:hypothetical protein Q5752_003492 [Cryptotrichosporon argae]
MIADQHDAEADVLATNLFADDEVADDPFAQLSEETSATEPDVDEAATAIEAGDVATALEPARHSATLDSEAPVMTKDAVESTDGPEPTNSAIDTAPNIKPEEAPAAAVPAIEELGLAVHGDEPEERVAPVHEAASVDQPEVDIQQAGPALAGPEEPHEPLAIQVDSAVPPTETPANSFATDADPQEAPPSEMAQASAASATPDDDAPVVDSEQPVSHEKDFSDLLAEFAEFEDGEPALGGTDRQATAEPANPVDNAAAALGLGDDDEFPIGDSDEAAQTFLPAQPAANEAVQMAATLFADEDSAFDIGVLEESSSEQALAEATDPFAAVGQKEDGNAPIEFEVPQGWYDDANEWHWYTDEEREQVRLAMAGQAATWEAEPEPAPIPVQTLSPLVPQVSENAARRTPVPADTATMPSQPSLDAYAPSVTAYAPTAPAASPYAPSSYTPYAPSASAAASYVPATSAYTPAYGQTAYAPSYAPAQSYASPAVDPYALTAQASSYAPASAGPSKAASPSQPKAPSAPRRVASNAYDPPFLKPQKSFVRPPSAAPQPITGFSPALHAAPLIASQALPPPPPSGPPKRSKTPVAAPSFEPPPPAMPPPSLPQAFQDAHGLQSPHDAPLRQPVDYANAPDPSTASPYMPGPPQASCAPPATTSYDAPPSDAYAPQQSNIYASQQPPPRPTSVPAKQAKPTFSAFDPPMRPKSVARAASRPAFASPPPRTAMPPVTVTPPRGPPAALAPGRASPLAPLKHAQIYDDRPAYAPPRINSPLKPRRSLGTPYGDSRAVRAERQEWDNDNAALPPRAAIGLDEEVDPEGGQGDWEEEATQPEFAASRPPAADFSHGPNDGYEPYQSTVEPVRDAYQPNEKQAAYDPYKTSQQGHSDTDYTPYQTDEPPARENVHDDPYAPKSLLGLERAPPPAHDPYGPASAPPVSPRKPAHGRDIYGSPQQTRATPINVHNPYASAKPSGLPNNAYDSYTPHEPSRSLVSPATQVSRQSVTYEPSYGAPPASTGLFAPPTDPYGRAGSPAYSSEFGVSPSVPNYFQAAPLDPTYVPQQVLDQRPVSEDPLGRCTMAARNAPLAVFGFGGAIITAFPASADPSGTAMSHARAPSYGYASSRGQVLIRQVTDVVEASALKSNEASFPGPLVLDPSAAKGAAAEKKRKEAVIAYLNARAEEIERGLPYLKSSASHAKREAEGKLVVVRLLSALVHGDGKMFGTPDAEAAVRAALQPPASATTATGLSPASAVTNGFNGSTFVAQAQSAVATSAQRAQLSSLLLHGDKRGACGFATEQGLWSHALVISSAVDRDLWTETVLKFAASELDAAASTAALRAVYALFSGVTVASVDELVAAANITQDPSADQWREVVSAVVFNGKPPDLLCLDELGNRLARLGLVNAAQACYLLSPNSPFSDVSPGAFERQVMLIENTRDDDGTVFAEVAEYARSLVPTPKGAEPPIPSLPQLLPYKLQRAWRAAELGEVEVAQKYCRAIDAAAKPSKSAHSGLPRRLAASMEDLLERLTGTPSTTPAMAVSRKRAKSGATIGSWIEGRLTKFIAGEDDGTAPAKPAPAKGTATAPVGPFSHFSTISPGASGAISRVPSTLDVTPSAYGTSPGAAQTALPAAGHQSGHLMDPSRASSSSSSYGDTYQHGYHSSYTPWAGDSVAEGEGEDGSTPTGYEPFSGSADGFINPMAQAQAPPTPSANDYQSRAQEQKAFGDDDDDDLGFGNSSLSRGKTPAPPTGGAEPAKPAEKKAEPAKADATTSPKLEQKPSGWLRGWWGKKEGEGSGPIRAKLGEESSMVYDPELKRWVVKGAKGEKTVPAATPPPPRAQTVSPSHAMRPEPAASRAMSATPPPSHRPNGAAPPRLASAPSAPPATRSSLSESITAADVPPLARAPASAGSPSGPLPNRAPGASLDDLLSRPASKRPGSAAAKKSARSRYVDVFQQDGA